MKVAIISGIRRIGFYIAQYLLNQRYNLAILYKNSSKEAEELKSYAESLDLKVLTFKVDLSRFETYSAVPERVYNSFGRIDLLLNVASPFGKTDIFKTTVEEFEGYWKPIVEASFFLSREAAKFMLLNKGEIKGRVINFGDWATVVGNPYKNFAAYLIAKGGLDTLTKVLAVELAPHILVNEIALGPVLPPMLEGKEKVEHWESYINQKTLLKRAVGLEDILSAVDFFVKTKSVSGEILTLDAGQRFVGKGY
jgi:NAD(P)-dependent dehydrogenase (short-subunit alcohol dehydrogenase family)